MLYNPPPGATSALAGYSGANPGTGVQGSKVPPQAVEYPQRELVNLIAGTGLTPTNGDLTQALQALWIGCYIGAFGGTANALTLTLPGGVQPTALVAGMSFEGLIGATSNTSSTVTLIIHGFFSAAGATAVVKRDGVTPLAIGDLPINTRVRFLYDGTKYRFCGLTISDISAVVNAFTNPVITPYIGNTVPGGFYSWNTSTGNFVLPNPAGITGSYTVRVLATSTPTGYQTAAYAVATGAGDQNIYYRGNPYNPFYSPGSGEEAVFELVNGQWIVGFKGQPQAFFLNRSNTTTGTTAGSGSSLYLPFNTLGGDGLQFSSNAGGVSVPVSGTYSITASCQVVGTTSTIQNCSLTLGGNGSSPVVYTFATAAASNTITASLSAEVVTPLNQGDAVVPLVTVPAGFNLLNQSCTQVCALLLR